MKLQLRVMIAGGVLTALALSGCSSDGDESTSTAAVTAGTSEDGGGVSEPVASGTGTGAVGYEELCLAKRETGDAVQDAMNEGSQALDDGEVDAAREAYIVYYDAYEADVDAIVALSGAIRDDPAVPEEVVAGAEEAIEAGGELFDETVARARSGLESAETVEEIRQVFTDFHDDLRGVPPEYKPQLLPPEIMRWSMEPDAPCKDG